LYCVPSEDFVWPEVYAALSAVGCPRLAFLLTCADPRDPLDEALAGWKLSVASAGGEKGVCFAVEPVGFLVDAHVFKPLNEEVVERWAGEGGVHLDALVAVDRELARLIELVEADFREPGLEGFFDRYVDRVAEVRGWYEDLVSDRDAGEGELREWAERGVGVLEEVRLAPVRQAGPVLQALASAKLVLRVNVKGSSELPSGLREVLRRRWEARLLGALREVAGLLALVRYSGAGGFVFAHRV